jgi:hypothetical protein
MQVRISEKVVAIDVRELHDETLGRPVAATARRHKTPATRAFRPWPSIIGGSRTERRSQPSALTDFRSMGFGVTTVALRL